MKRLSAVFALSVFLTSALPALAADAGTFDPRLVLTDEDLTDARVPDGFVQEFLESKGGGIASMKFQDIDGSMKSPGALITYYARIYRVNPKFLLALIQKEQSLVEDRTPDKCQIDWAAGYGRPDGSTCDDSRFQRYRGFVNQIVNAAEFVRHIYDLDLKGERRAFGFFAGKSAVIDGVPVIPGNIATAILYTYTPHLHGNRLLANIWNRWFMPLYPDGSVLSDGRGNAYLIQQGTKRLFVTKGALHSRVDASRVIRVSDDVLSSFPDGAPIKFADYTLVKDVSTGRVYLLVRDVRRHIVSKQVFRVIGFNPEEIEDVAADEIAGYREGDPITLKSSYPTGGLLQDKKTGGVYFVQDGRKQPIYSAEILKANFPGRKLSPVSASVLEAYPTESPLKFRDGELVTSPGSNGTVFVISNGMRRPFASDDVMVALGYAKTRLITTNEKALGIHPLGPVVTLAAPADGGTVALTP